MIAAVPFPLHRPRVLVRAVGLPPGRPLAGRAVISPRSGLCLTRPPGLHVAVEHCPARASACRNSSRHVGCCEGQEGGNIPRKSGIAGWLLGFAGFAGNSARIPRVVKLNMVEDEKALRGQLSEWAELPSLKTILVSHGDVIRENPRQTLRRSREDTWEGVTEGTVAR